MIGYINHVGELTRSNEMLQQQVKKAEEEHQAVVAQWGMLEQVSEGFPVIHQIKSQISPIDMHRYFFPHCFNSLCPFVVLTLYIVHNS